MILEITQYGNPVLRKKCRKVTEVTDELKQFGEDLIETMVQAQGVGLAAPQVNRDIQMAVVDVSHDPECITFLKVDGEESSLDDLMPLVFINPSLEFGSLKESATEGCLSIEGINAEVRVRLRLRQLSSCSTAVRFSWKLTACYLAPFNTKRITLMVFFLWTVYRPQPSYQ